MVPPPAARASLDRRLRSAASSIANACLAAALLLLIALPLVALLVSSTPGRLLQALADPIVWPAVRLSLLTTTATLGLTIVSGTPLAWLLARRQGRWWRFVETALQLPIVLPPAVAGVALLLAFGRRGLLGPGLSVAGIGVPFTRAAVVLAQSFVAAPLYVQSAVAAFRRVDRDPVLVARTLGGSWPRVFLTIVIPLARPGLAAGAAMCWARALGEFGATLMFAGNLEGRTQTLPLAIYSAAESDLRTAQALSVVLLAVAFALLVGVRSGQRR